MEQCKDISSSHLYCFLSEFSCFSNLMTIPLLVASTSSNRGCSIIYPVLAHKPYWTEPTRPQEQSCWLNWIFRLKLQTWRAHNQRSASRIWSSEPENHVYMSDLSVWEYWCIKPFKDYTRLHWLIIACYQAGTSRHLGNCGMAITAVTQLCIVGWW